MDTKQRVLLSHDTALEYLRALGWRGVADSRLLPEFPADMHVRRLKPGGGGSVCGRRLETLLEGKLRGLVVPIDVLVDDPAERRNSSLLRCHVWNRPLPERSFIDIGDGVFVSAPELCFMQMCKNYEVTELVRLGYELTGSYSLMNRGCAWGLYWLAASTADDGEGWPWSEVRADSAIWPNIIGWLRERHVPTFCQRPPLVSIGRLRRYAELARGFYGRGRALRALKYVVPGSASPMETALVMLLCLPCSLGGYGLPLPVMNHHVGQNMPRDSIAGKEYYVCDLYWPDAGLDVEYDSDLCHTGPDRIADDSARRDALKELGVDVITVTWQQIRSLRSMALLWHMSCSSVAGCMT